MGDYNAGWAEARDRKLARLREEHDVPVPPRKGAHCVFSVPFVVLMMSFVACFCPQLCFRYFVQLRGR